MLSASVGVDHGSSESAGHECERAVRDKHMTVAESNAPVRNYEAGLAGYTYLETENGAAM